MRLSDFDFDLPEELIALRPVEPRDSARLLTVGAAGGFGERRVCDLADLLRPGDALVMNDTRVIPARLIGVRVRGESAVAVEATLHRRLAGHLWSAFAKPGKRLKVGDLIRFGETADRACMFGTLDAVVKEKHEDGEIVLGFHLTGPDLDMAISERGAMPLPPYIAARRGEDERDRADYQTVYARPEGSVAAPTAGLHFTPELLAALDARGVRRGEVVLHVGAGTFKPVETDDPADHLMHEERYVVPDATAQALVETRAAGRRVWAVGTTSVRTLESAAEAGRTVRAGAGETRIFLRPPAHPQVVDALVTNFHLPRSTLIMLVAAFAGHDLTMRAYHEAIAARYRFYSYGDAMAIV
jgi:S-adenosylmethionine:tRNA ribosyltransferase-isomerase